MRKALNKSTILMVLFLCLVQNSILQATGNIAPPNQSKIKVKGLVKQTNNDPIIGATIKQKNSPTNGTISDIDGNFSLEVPTDATLEVSYIPILTKSQENIP